MLAMLPRRPSMKSRSISVLLAGLMGAALAGPAQSQSLIDPNTGLPATDAASRARIDAEARSRADSEIRANQMRREQEETANRLRGNAGLGTSTGSTPINSGSMGIGPGGGTGVGIGGMGSGGSSIGGIGGTGSLGTGTSNTIGTVPGVG